METKKSKVWNVFLWVAQLFLALAFIAAGTMKTITPVEELAKSMSWVNDVSESMVRFIGISEILGGIGLILPSLLKIKPVLTPVAAIGIAVIMVLAIGLHVMKSEFNALPVNVFLLALALFVTWGRLKKVPIN